MKYIDTSLLLLTITTHLRTFALATSIAACAYLICEMASSLNTSAIQMSLLNV